MYFRWIGGKSKLVDTILKMMPRHKVYVEPFIGAGWVFWNKVPAKTEVINDLDKRLIKFYIGLRSINDLKEVIDKYGWAYGNKDVDVRQMFYRAIGIIENDDLYSLEEFVWAFLFVNKFSFAGRMVDPTFNPRRLKDCIRPYCGIIKLINDFHKIKKRLSKTIILNEDWEEPTIRYDSEDTLFYFDPPYVGTSNNGFTDRDYKTRIYAPTPKTIFRVISKLEGKFILSYDYHPTVLKYIKKYNLYYKVVNVDYEVRQNNKTVKEVIVTNFDFNKQRSLADFF